MKVKYGIYSLAKNHYLVFNYSNFFSNVFVLAEVKSQGFESLLLKIL